MVAALVASTAFVSGTRAIVLPVGSRFGGFSQVTVVVFSGETREFPLQRHRELRPDHAGRPVRFERRNEPRTEPAERFAVHTPDELEAVLDHNEAAGDYGRGAAAIGQGAARAVQSGSQHFGGWWSETARGGAGVPGWKGLPVQYRRECHALAILSAELLVTLPATEHAPGTSPGHRFAIVGAGRR